MRFKQFLEMPINQAELIGKGWNKFPPNQKQHQNWDKASYNILTNNIEKLKNAWSKVPQTFDMYFVKDTNMRKHLQRGEVNEEYVRRELGFKGQIHQDHITVFFTSNIGADRVPMTPWTVGHRFWSRHCKLTSFSIFCQRSVL